MPSSLLFSQVITERPFRSNSAHTLKKSQFLLEGGMSISQGESFTIETYEVTAFSLPDLKARYALNDRIEVRSYVSYARYDLDHTTYSYSKHGLQDIQVGFKYRLTKNPEKKTKFAIGTNLIVPIDEEMGDINRQVGFSGYLALDHTFSNKSVLRSNYHGFYGIIDGGSNLATNLSIDYWYPVSAKTGLIINYGGYYDSFLDSINSYAGTGLTYLVRPNVQFDFSFASSLTLKSYGGLVGLSYLIG